MTTLRHVLLCLYCLAYMVLAAPVELEWDANPPADNVIRYQVVHARTAPLTPVMLTTSTTPAATVDLQPGDSVYVIAVNAAGIPSAPSNVVTVPFPPSAPKNLRIIEIQTSFNLKDWSTDGYYVVRQPQTDGPQFLRTIAKIAPYP